MVKEIEVKTIWSEMVKPWDPTPCELRTKRLSILDQLATPFHVPTLLFYSAAALHPDHDQAVHVDAVVNKMKTSLSKALSRFYPLAGTFLDDSTLVCDDQGALLIHTRVTSSLESYFSLILASFHLDHNDHHKTPNLLVDKLLPPPELLHGSHELRPIPISAWLQLAFQVNVFECGGIVIGCYMSHKILDGISAATFLRHWASLSSATEQQADLPNFDAIVDTFPPDETTKLRDDHEQLGRDVLQVNEPTTTTVSVKAFVFKPNAISCIRDKAASERIPNPSRIESVVGFLWKQCLEAEVEVEEEGPTSLVLTVDMRSRTYPPLPRESMGNLATNVVARAHKKGLGLADTVVKIRGAINEFEDKDMRNIQGEKGGEALREHKKMINQEFSSYCGSNNFSTTYIVSCQCRVGFTDLDFGFGKPYWIYPFVGVVPSMRKHYFIILVDHIDSTIGNNGIEAWLILDKKQMQRLDTNPDFLAYASPLASV